MSHELDIFIDNCIASRFTTPKDPKFKQLIAWLIHSDKKNTEKNAFLVVSNKLLAEYNRTNSHADGGTNIIVIIEILKREGRIIKISNEAIKNFKRQNFKKRIIRNLQSNPEDRDHIPVVLLSDRKMALTQDENLTADLNGFPGFTVQVSNRLENLPYSG